MHAQACVNSLAVAQDPRDDAADSDMTRDLYGTSLGGRPCCCQPRAPPPAFPRELVSLGLCRGGRAELGQ